MLASGRVNISTITMDRLQQDCPLGFELCGRDIKGRKIIAIANNRATASIVVADKNSAFEIPESWGLEDASTALVVYCTVLYAFRKVGTIKSGMSVLIHSATGGIGLAALNICLYHGFEIFATVGTQEKRDYLKENYPQIPDSHIGNSRDTSFEEMIKNETKGRGVDIVLNSLAEEKLRASVRSVAPGGYFLEIGKYDLGIDSSLEMLFMERNISYHGVMLDQVFNNSEYLKNWLMGKLLEGMKLGYVKPLPRTIFQKEEVLEAYKYMTKGKHIGKILIKLHDENESVDSLKERLYKAHPRFSCDPEKSYIVIGGLGGIGMELADWLYLREVKKLVLVSRTGIQSGYQKQRIRTWIKSGVRVQISTKDITTCQGCLDLINEAKELGPVDAIFNLAVILKDSLFGDQTEEAFHTSFGPKAQATINLDKITREHCPNLRYFVVFSSVSCGRGNIGQTNYGMANSVMERVCEQRQQDGLPGLAIQWGAIGDVGLVAKMQKENKELVIGGTLQQKISSCLEVLDKFLNQNHPIVSSMVVAEKRDRSASMGSAVEAVAYILGIKDMKTVNPQTSLAELGMDSMMGVELIQTLEKDFDIYLTAKEIRTLTFGRLMELDQERKKDESGPKTKKQEHILKLLPRENNGDTSVTLLDSQFELSNDTPSIFVFPGIEGVFSILEPITKNVKGRNFVLDYSIRNSEISIEDTANTILPMIEKKISTDRPFFFVGYSYGAVVATELIALLESKGYRGTLIAIEGSPTYLTAAAKDNFPESEDNQLQTALIFRVLSLFIPMESVLPLKEKFLNCESFEERIRLSVSLVPPEMRTLSPSKEAMVALFHRFKATMNYKFSHEKIKSSVRLYKAKFPMLAEFAEDYQFSEVCQEPVQVTALDGDHSTILNQNQLIEDINKLIGM